MPKSNTPAVQPAANAGDLIDALNLSKHYYESLFVLIKLSRNQLSDSIKALQQVGFPALSEDYFHTAFKLLEIAEDLSERCGVDAEQDLRIYEAEWKAFLAERREGEE